MTSKKYIKTGKGLPKWSNPISHSVVINNMCFVSGQLSINIDGKYVSGSVKEEAILAFSNFFAVIENSDFSINDIVFIDIAFDDLSNLSELEELYIKYFPKGKRPARTIYQVEALPFGGKIKIMGTAVKEIE